MEITEYTVLVTEEFSCTFPVILAIEFRKGSLCTLALCFLFFLNICALEMSVLRLDLGAEPLTFRP